MERFAGILLSGAMRGVCFDRQRGHENPDEEAYLAIEGKTGKGG